MKAINIKVEHLKSPIGIDIKKPYISWNCDDGIQQTAYIINAYNYCNDKKGDLFYSTNKCHTSDMFAYFQGPLHSRQRVLIEITLFDENDVQGETQSTVFETAFLDKNQWVAKWINPEIENLTKVNSRPASYLKKTFNVEKTGTSRLYITAHGLYTAFINNQRVGDYVLTPGTSEYSVNLEYQTYDVTELINEGKNEIVVVLGDGWYRGKSGMNNPNGNLFGDDISLLAQLEINGASVLITDESWQASQYGPILKNGLDFGEVVDSTIGDGFFAIEKFHQVKIENFGYQNLKCSNNVHIKEKEKFEGTVIKTPNGDTVIDFGQNIAGYVSFSVKAKQGQKIKLVHGEGLDENGNFTIDNFQHEAPTPENMIYQQVEYICKEGQNEYKPQFCIFGFQYVKVETDINIDDIKFTAQAVYSDMDETGSFVCGNEDVNKLVKNSLWSMKGNFADIPTDCPTRERQGWTGDAAAFVNTGMYLMDCYPVFRKWLNEVRANQLEDGKIPGVAPNSEPDGFFKKLSNGSAGWADAITIVPNALCRVYNCTDIVKENYGAMKKWVDFCEKRAHKSRIKSKLKVDKNKKYIVDTGFHWGEWLEPDVNSKDALKQTLMKGSPEVPTAYFAYSAYLLSVAAKKTGKDSESKYYLNLSEKIKEAYRAYFVKNGKINSDRQASYVRPVALDILNQSEKQTASDNLNELVKNNNYHLNTGFLSTPFLCSVLSSYGHTDTAYKLLLQDTAPSWLYEVKKGATTIWETWNGIDENHKVSASLNHYSYGAIAGWLFGDVAGIKLNYGKITIAPHPDKSIGFASATYNSPLGKISSKWEYKNNGIIYSIEIPANCTAEIILPNGEKHNVTAGKYTFS